MTAGLAECALKESNENPLVLDLVVLTICRTNICTIEKVQRKCKSNSSMESWDYQLSYQPT